MDHFAALAAFIRVAEQGSFSAAARAMKTTQPTISKAIAELEQRLGARLLNRTTRTLSLTEVGATYYQRTRRLLRQLEDADREVVLGREAIQGRLRVNTSALLAGRMVVPALVAFQEANPAVRVEIVVDDKRIDPVASATDVAVRIGGLASSGLRARRAGSAENGVWVAPSYLDRLGVEAETLTGFAGMQLIRYADQRRTTEAGVPEALDNFTVSNGLVAREVMLAGAGIAVLPFFLVAEDVAAGRTVRLLPDLEIPPAEVNLLHAFSQDAPASVSAFLDFAVAMWRRSGLLQA